MKVSRIASLVLLAFALAAPLSAQDALTKVRELYAAAAFTDALAALDKGPAVETSEAGEYRILCLLALGRDDRAEAALDTLLQTFPKYQPDQARVSPKRRAQIESARGRIIRRRYDEAKASFEAGDFAAAALRFDRVIAAVSNPSGNAALADLRMLATGFRDLANVNANPPPAPLPGVKPVAALGTPATNSAARAAGTSGVAVVPGAIFDATAADVEPPMPLKPIVAPAAPPQPVAGSGLFEIVIDETGRVESATVRRPISPEYDTLLLNDARGWRYRPATRAGTPVKFRKVIEIYTTALASIRR